MALLAVLIGGGVFGGVTYGHMLQNDVALTHDAVSHLQSAEAQLKDLSGRPFDSTSSAAAKGEFAAALADFTRVSSDLTRVPAVAALVPHYGEQLRRATPRAPGDHRHDRG